MRPMQARGTYAKGEAKRQEILDAATDSFVEKGYDRTSVREIARAVGLSQAGLLHHFATKEELFLEVLRRRDERSLATRDERGAHSLENFIGTVERNAQEGGLVALYVAMSAESSHNAGKSRDFFHDRFRWVLDDIAADVARLQEEGVLIRDTPARDIASILVAASDGLQLQWLVDPEGVDMAGRMHALLDTFRA